MTGVRRPSGACTVSLVVVSWPPSFSAPTGQSLQGTCANGRAVNELSAEVVSLFLVLPTPSLSLAQSQPHWKN